MTTRPDGAVISTPFPDYEVEDPLTGAKTVRTTYRFAGQIVAIQKKVGTGTSDFYYTYSDHLGNVAALSSKTGVFTAGSLARYDPFGNYRTWPGSNVNPAITNHGFTGHRHNNTGPYPTQNVGLIYMNARYYLPEVGRFISPDTIVPEPENPQSFNRYSYVRNNPLNFTDPTGHTICRPGEGFCQNPLDFAPISFDTGNNAINMVISLAVNLTCGAIGGLCKAENNAIIPTSDEEYMANQDLTALANPIAMVGRGIVTYAGKHFFKDTLESVLTRGKRFAIDSAGYLVERVPGAVKEFDVIRYGARTLRAASGLEAHHGVMDAFFVATKYPGYSTNDAPAIMLNPSAHAKATAVFNEWAIERFGALQKIDWTVLSHSEVMSLSKQMFDAAGVPQEAQNNYFATFWYYINQLEP